MEGIWKISDFECGREKMFGLDEEEERIIRWKEDGSFLILNVKMFGVDEKEKSKLVWRIRKRCLMWMRSWKLVNVERKMNDTNMEEKDVGFERGMLEN